MLSQAIRIHVGEPINQVSGKYIKNSQRNCCLKHLKLLLEMKHKPNLARSHANDNNTGDMSPF